MPFSTNVQTKRNRFWEKKPNTCPCCPSSPLTNLDPVPSPLSSGLDPSWDPTGRFCVPYDMRWTNVEGHSVNPPIPWSLPPLLDSTENPQAWDDYCPSCTREGGCSIYPCQMANIKEGKQGDEEVKGLYDGIETGCDPWVSMACEEARFSAEHRGGPFGAVIVRIDDETNSVTEFWRSHNHVVLWSDPTAHAEVTTIRFACADLSRRFQEPITDLGNLIDPVTKRKSHCAIYVSAEPCPMCYAAINWAGIPVAVFACTRFDAAVPGVDFSDEQIYADMARPYSERENVTVRQASCPNSLDAFNLWKRSDTVHY